MIPIGKGLLDYCDLQQLERFVKTRHAIGKEAWLAVSISRPELAILWTTGVDVVGVRGAACIAGEGSGSFDALDQRIVAGLVGAVYT